MSTTEKTPREIALEAQVAALKKQLADEREARRREDQTVRNLLNDVLADIERGSR